ncbi:hypothetical protein [Neorhizobium sp. NCHU2750]|nr:purine permease [Neorhizobium sp. NCHU2750]
MIPIVSAALIKKLPHDLQPLLESGILLSAVAVVILNVFFNALASREEV